jgi:hypothetical protein
MATIHFEAEPKNLLLVLRVEGVVTVEELDQLIRDTAIKVKAFGGQPFGILVDLRTMLMSSAGATERIKAHQTQLMKLGLRKSAEVVGSAGTALQLNRVARESGMAPMLQRFTDFDVARKWLAEP